MTFKKYRAKFDVEGFCESRSDQQPILRKICEMPDVQLLSQFNRMQVESECLCGRSL